MRVTVRTLKGSLSHPHPILCNTAPDDTFPVPGVTSLTHKAQPHASP